MPSPSPEDFLDRPLLRQLAGDKSLRAARNISPRAACASSTSPGTASRRRSAVRALTGSSSGADAANSNSRATARRAARKLSANTAWRWASPGLQGRTDSRRLRQPASEVDRRPRRTTRSRDQLRDHLRRLDKDRLVSLVLEATDYDDILRRRLLLETIGVPPADRRQPPRRTPAPRPAPDLELTGKSCARPSRCADYVDYDAMPDYAQGVEEAIYPLGELLRAATRRRSSNWRSSP